MYVQGVSILSVNIFRGDRRPIGEPVYSERFLIKKIWNFRKKIIFFSSIVRKFKVEFHVEYKYLSTCLKNSVKNHQFKNSIFQGQQKRVMGTKNVRKTKSYVTKEKKLKKMFSQKYKVFWEKNAKDKSMGP